MIGCPARECFDPPGSPSALSGYVCSVADEFDLLLRSVERGQGVVSVGGLAGISAKSFAVSELARLSGRQIAVVTDSNADLDTWLRDLGFFLDRGLRIVGLPSFDSDPYSNISPHAETEERRAIALWQIARGEADIVVMSARSVIQRTLTPAAAAGLAIELRRDDEMPPEALVERLVSVGYVREEPLYGPGQYSLRGGIVDLWSPDASVPVRIEFFGDTVDSIRTFDPETQLSIEQLRETSVAPMREFAAGPDEMRAWSLYAKERFADERFARNLRDRTELADDGETFPGWEFLFPLCRRLEGTALEYLHGHLLVIDEPAMIESALISLYDHFSSRHLQLSEYGDIGLEPHELFVPASNLRTSLDGRQRVELRALGRTAAAEDEQFALGEDGKPLFLFPTAAKAEEITIRSRSTRRYHGDIAAFAAEYDGSVEIVAGTHGMAERIAEVLRDRGKYLPMERIRIGSLSSGFELPGTGMRFVTESDILGETGETAARSAQPPVRASRSRLGAFISDFRDLKPGDLVVHIDHGIGRFDGLQTISSQGTEREFMLLIYADNAKLFVPVERMDLVSRYSSGETAEARLDRLGGIGWQKTKAKAKRAMRDMADELLKLYAERKLVRGHAFPPDAPWQHEFEDAFPYELTADQASAIEDVKSDMEAPVPMDRLIIGDVGYGKTEVAMRAAFKAVMDGKQVAVLAPTTILAYQHFESFTRRFAAFPIKVELISRFRTAKEQKEVASAAEKGDLDVLIGTHRLLSNDVKLPKLGLVVVDEEQRFGVGHKEKLKHLKKKVDVLTLSATPIPRTLNMSLIGMRDMSVIETPPRDRLAINTQVVQFSEGVIRSAVELELSRSGQIFFIHNRVESIDSVAALIKKIVPEARVAVGHGQMNEKEMEQVMLDFIDYKYDVLVATTIIENGIDIPRANTIIINRADNYGLSQLYQLRGRVGRSNRRAYAYLLIPSELELTPIARRRLSAIREFSDLGAGFRLAALDLELRGAGNILGGQQSGHLDALGFDLYTKMLERTIAEMRGDEIADDVSVSINLGVDVSIPQDLISDAGQRLRTYKRIASAGGDEELAAIRSEVEDRYGRIPRSVENLFEYGRLRKFAERVAIVSIDRTADGIAIKLGDQARVSPEALMRFIEVEPGATFSPSGILRVSLEPGDAPIAAAYRALAAVSDDRI